MLLMKEEKKRGSKMKKKQRKRGHKLEAEA